MRILTIVCLFGVLRSLAASAEESRKFPYEAEVEADDLHVRSGPGTRYYPTGRLHAGQRVKVRRHDPGGWLMIEPPEGSFSLIPAEIVEKNDNQTGTVVGDGVKVFMGGVRNEPQGVTQKELNQGDLVEILGEMELSINGPTHKWYKIRPPQGEFRWVAGQYVRPVGETRAAHKAIAESSAEDETYDPFASKPQEPAKKSKPAENNPRSREKNPLAGKISKNGAIAQTGPSLEVLAVERERLQQLDQQWELMVQREPQHWQIDQMEQAYRQLQSELTATVLQRQIDFRLASLKEHRKIYGDMAEFRRIKEQTDLRDMELRQGFAPSGQPGNNGSVSERFERPVLQAGNNPGAQPSAGQPANVSPAGGVITSPSAITPAGGPSSPSNSNGFIATGRLYNTGNQGTRLFQPKMPQFMVVSPSNQVIAFLHATPNVNLASHVGRNVGIQGSRWNQPGIQYPVISVTQIVPLDQNEVTPASQQNNVPAQGMNSSAQMNGPAQPYAGTTIVGLQQPAAPTPPSNVYSQTYGATASQQGNVQNMNWAQPNGGVQQAVVQNGQPVYNTVPNQAPVQTYQQPSAWRPVTNQQYQPYQAGMPVMQQPQTQYNQPQYNPSQFNQQQQFGAPQYRQPATQGMTPLPTVSLPFGYRPASSRQPTYQNAPNGRQYYNGMNSSNIPMNPLGN